MDELMRQVATNAAEYAVGKYGQNLPKAKQIALWKRYYDNSLSSLITFHELQHARRIRAQALISEN
jgi:hypothetical protein